MLQGDKKQCSKCSKWFPLGGFPERRQNVDGHRSYCYDCYEKKLEEKRKKKERELNGCPYPSRQCYRNKEQGLCCLTCTKYHDCEQACKNTPEKCGYKGELV